MGEWKRLSEFPTDMILAAQAQIIKYNRERRGIFIFLILFIFFTNLFSIGAQGMVWEFILTNIFCISIIAVIWYISRMKTRMMDLTACEDLVLDYTPATSGRYSHPAYVTTVTGKLAFIYDNNFYQHGDRVFIVKAGIIGRCAFCVGYAADYDST
ncbi:MAG: hypothetical protein IJ251_07950 [Oscillospiraceae bacterium]|nr:hypothetical protein [Oscillospiraceae bacterium]